MKEANAYMHAYMHLKYVNFLKTFLQKLMLQNSPSIL